LSPGLWLSKPEYRVHLDMLVVGTPAAELAGHHRALQQISFVVLEQMKLAVATLLDVHVSKVTASVAEVEHSDATANLAIVTIEVHVGNLEESGTAATVLRGSIDSAESATHFFAAAGLTVQSAPTIDIVEHTSVLSPIPAWVIVLAAGLPGLCILLIVCRVLGLHEPMLKGLGLLCKSSLKGLGMLGKCSAKGLRNLGLCLLLLFYYMGRGTYFMLFFYPRAACGKCLHTLSFKSRRRGSPTTTSAAETSDTSSAAEGIPLDDVPEGIPLNEDSLTLHTISAPVGLAVVSSADLKNATEGYSADRLIGKGGFGAVYIAKKMRPLPLSEATAVKKLSDNAMQGLQEFENEINLLCKLRHENLLPLIGCCEQPGHVCLIYPLMRGGNFGDALLGKALPAAMTKLDGGGSALSWVVGALSPTQRLGWKSRVTILRDAMRGLAFLHASNVLHRDVKPANILLEPIGDRSPSFNARLADVGLAKEINLNVNSGQTHVSSIQQIGTPGFIDPLVTNLGHYSEETDAYAFGMTIAMALLGKPIVEALEAIDEVVEEPSLCLHHVDPTAKWPAEGDQAVGAGRGPVLELAEVIKGLVGPRLRKNRLPFDKVVECIERIAEQASLQNGVHAASESKECIICMAKPRATRFMCGHSICCEECASILQDRCDPCPSCRCRITVVLRGEHLSSEQTFVQLQGEQA
jgi:serine/threonine protein kinase